MRGTAGPVEIVEHGTLAEERRFRRVQVFCRRIGIEGAAAEGDDAAARVADREHDAVAEAVVGDGDVLARHDQPRLLHQVGRHALFGEMGLQRIAIVGRIADAEIGLDGGGETAVGKISARLRSLGFLQLAQEEGLRQVHDIVETGALRLALAVGLGDLGHRQARIAGQPLDGLGKRQPLLLDQEAKDVARRPASKAVVDPLAIVGMEGRRLLGVERAASPEVAARRGGLLTVPLHAATDDRGDRHAIADVVEELGREFHVSRCLRPHLTRRATGSRALIQLSTWPGPIFQIVLSTEHRTKCEHFKRQQRVLQTRSIRNIMAGDTFR